VLDERVLLGDRLAGLLVEDRAANLDRRELVLEPALALGARDALLAGERQLVWARR
jgi:hypothetical protein